MTDERERWLAVWGVKEESPVSGGARTPSTTRTELSKNQRASESYHTSLTVGDIVEWDTYASKRSPDRGLTTSTSSGRIARIIDGRVYIVVTRRFTRMKKARVVESEVWFDADELHRLHRLRVKERK